MPVAPPARRKSPDRRSRLIAERVPVHERCHDRGHEDCEEPLSWDHFAAEVADASRPVVVRCRGGLDFAYTDRLREVFAGITEREVVVDLRRLTFVDSTGLSVLLSTRRTLQEVGGKLSIYGATGLVRRVFEIAELSDVLDD